MNDSPSPRTVEALGQAGHAELIKAGFFSSLDQPDGKASKKIRVKLTRPPLKSLDHVKLNYYGDFFFFFFKKGDRGGGEGEGEGGWGGGLT